MLYSTEGVGRDPLAEVGIGGGMMSGMSQCVRTSVEQKDRAGGSGIAEFR